MVDIDMWCECCQEIDEQGDNSDASEASWSSDEIEGFDIVTMVGEKLRKIRLDLITFKGLGSLIVCNEDSIRSSVYEHKGVGIFLSKVSFGWWDLYRDYIFSTVNARGSLIVVKTGKDRLKSL